MYKSYLKKIVSSSVVASVVLLGTACNASSDDSKETTKAPTKEVAAKVESVAKAPAGETAEQIAKRLNPDGLGLNPAKPALSDTVKNKYDFNGKHIVDGGIYYPVVNGKTGAYHVNEAAHKATVSYGKVATKNEQIAWDIDIMPDGHGLPAGEGSAEFGDEVYEEKCVSCHGDFGAGDGLYPPLAKGNGYEGQQTLTNQRVNGNTDGPTRNFGSYWPYASTAWWYIKTGMPHQAPMSLTNDETYALVAYLLMINEIKVDGEEVDEDFVLSRENFKDIVMPNIDGFEPNIDGPQGQENARAYYNNTANYGNGSRCMKDCIDGEPEIQTIGNVIEDFEPALSSEKSLPAKKADAKPEHPGKATYDKSCAMCHTTDAMGAPATGDKAAWDALLKGGKDSIYKNAIHGKGGMPPKGGAMSLSDDQVKEIVDYMLEESK
ncbi:MAG: membrane c-type cytochrome cy [uncultured Sulfurovum sp.]|uniref:Membrane c-type cytochrome cy n=1 Tax=uncultured Sulfurovum sp. TaxID=269237 RepID=A0A6S6TC67_9BACT|nr:MAG: membrane c-type cytochrome cy [uncultured Sulfurovum sp.]